MKKKKKTIVMMLLVVVLVVFFNFYKLCPVVVFVFHQQVMMEMEYKEYSRDLELSLVSFV
jgi:hypothetical protein